jgi:predicted SAM-dependent methyltransferase
LKLEPAPAELLKLDLGCGPGKAEGFTGVDAIMFPGVDQVVDLRKAPWPWPDESVKEARASHFLEHLTAAERVLFFNELYRVLVDGGTCQIITPHWASCRAYGDPTHVWPPVSEFANYYILKSWRMANAPHTDAAFVPGGFTCDFDATWGYGLRPDLVVRNQEYQQFAMANYKEVITDQITTVTKRKAE